MSSTYTVDASVFVNGFNPYEAGHEESRRLLTLLQEQAAPIVAPTLLLPEVAAAIGRGRQDATLVLIPLDTTLAQQAADIAAQYRLRGSDAVYAAVALRFGSTLVTLDREQRERVDGVLLTRYPAEALTEWE